MGLNTNQNTNNALYILQGKIVKVATQETGNFEKNGKYYQAFDSITGLLTGFAIVDGYKDGDKDAVLKIKDGTDEWILKFGVNSGNFTSWSKSIQNADLLKELELVPTYKQDGDKKQSSLLIKQDGEWIKRKYTNDSMGELPVAMPVSLNGKVSYDYTAQLDYLINEISTIFDEAKLPF
tara:strand:- start:26 stop:562 length:537 start_codon:yes stop_codon:yes gene_type:complete